MANGIEDLWPKDFGNTDIATPVSVLRVQANLLTERTDGLLEGRVVSAGGTDGLVHTLSIKAPALGYQYHLLTIEHKVTLYPATVHNIAANYKKAARSPEEYKAFLREAFGDPKVLQVIRGLIAQSSEAGE